MLVEVVVFGERDQLAQLVLVALAVGAPAPLLALALRSPVPPGAWGCDLEPRARAPCLAAGPSLSPSADSPTATARRLHVGETVNLEREPENPYDANAIRVRLDDGAYLGYVARDAARGLAAHLDADPRAFDAEVREIDLGAPLLRLELRAR